MPARVDTLPYKVLGVNVERASPSVQPLPADGAFLFFRYPFPRTITSMAETTTTSEAAIFSRVLEADNIMLSPEAARSLLALDFSTADRQRMNRLAAKARKGSLSADEDRELDNYINVGHLLTILQSKARKCLKRRPAS